MNQKYPGQALVTSTLELKAGDAKPDPSVAVTFVITHKPRNLDSIPVALAALLVCPSSENSSTK